MPTGTAVLALGSLVQFPRPLDSYPPRASTLWDTLADRAIAEPFNLVATGIFAVAILHTFAAARFTAWAHHAQRSHDERIGAVGGQRVPHVGVEVLRFLGEVEVVFGLWAVVLAAAIAMRFGWHTMTEYVNTTVNYTEPLFVVVIMALASTRPIVTLAERALRAVAGIGGGTPAAWWMSILTVAPLFGSFITEPGAMTIAAVLLSRQFYDLRPSATLAYATLGLLFVNVSIGGTLTHFAAPPVLMVARPWEWDTPFMLSHFGWRAAVAIALSTAGYYLAFRGEFTELASRPAVPDVERPDEDAGGRLLAVPPWVTVVHVGFLVWTVVNAHYPALFLGGFLFFLGFTRATAAYQSSDGLRTPLLVGFFLAGLVIHGMLQSWWIGPVLASLSSDALFWGATLLTAFNDNALITYLATLVPNLGEPFKAAVVGGAVTGGGLTVIANAPNPAGQAILSRFFDDSVSPLKLAAGAFIPTLVAAAAFRLL
jgi:hypothetical protein